MRTSGRQSKNVVWSIFPRLPVGIYDLKTADPLDIGCAPDGTRVTAMSALGRLLDM